MSDINEQLNELKLDERFSGSERQYNSIPYNDIKKHDYIEKIRINEFTSLLKLPHNNEERIRKTIEILNRPLTKQEEVLLSDAIKDQYEKNKEYMFKIILEGLEYCSDNLCGYFTETTYTHTLYKYINQQSNIICTKEYGLPCKFNNVDIPLRYADIIAFKDDVCVIIELKKTKDYRITEEHINQLNFYKTLYNEQIKINNPYWPKTIHTLGIVVNFENIGNHPDSLVCDKPCKYSIKYV